jgi:hypothetical protein
MDAAMNRTMSYEDAVDNEKTISTPVGSTLATGEELSTTSPHHSAARPSTGAVNVDVPSYHNGDERGSMPASPVKVPVVLTYENVTFEVHH